VTNGYLRDYTDLDFLMSVLQVSIRVARSLRRPIDADAIVQLMPQTSIPNYIFRNANGLLFEQADWILHEPSFSNGATYADLDLDGVLDLVVNTINRVLFLSRNTVSCSLEWRYLRISREVVDSISFRVCDRGKDRE